jgi:hypothetical protein
VSHGVSHVGVCVCAQKQQKTKTELSGAVWLRPLTNLEVSYEQVLAPWNYAVLSGVESIVQR